MGKRHVLGQTHIPVQGMEGRERILAHRCISWPLEVPEVELWFALAEIAKASNSDEHVMLTPVLPVGGYSGENPPEGTLCYDPKSGVGMKWTTVDGAGQWLPVMVFKDSPGHLVAQRHGWPMYAATLPEVPDAADA